MFDGTIEVWWGCLPNCEAVHLQNYCWLFKMSEPKIPILTNRKWMALLTHEHTDALKTKSFCQFDKHWPLQSDALTASSCQRSRQIKNWEVNMIEFVSLVWHTFHCFCAQSLDTHWRCSMHWGIQLEASLSEHSQMPQNTSITILTFACMWKLFCFWWKHWERGATQSWHILSTEIQLHCAEASQ